ncbi:ferredoxin [Mycobacterium sp. 1423905.2]|uniref:ferredoxin n=1 Tax=Mycobacterium sp. 1423905.2 TaxID=1856859 RepID=UPI0007FF94B1|nr:ferredoxin [Mycobacterium sp. 1423905.2]OBJ55294.1 ferredoxin [Mycobacterium sp. 1423905.2]
MKLYVDRELCQGHSRCYATYPELFDIDDEGFAFVTGEDVPPGWDDRAHNAIANCPERAIHIKESP